MTNEQHRAAGKRWDYTVGRPVEECVHGLGEATVAFLASGAVGPLMMSLQVRYDAPGHWFTLGHWPRAEAMRRAVACGWPLYRIKPILGG